MAAIVNKAAYYNDFLDFESEAGAFRISWTGQHLELRQTLLFEF